MMLTPFPSSSSLCFIPFPMFPLNRFPIVIIGVATVVSQPPIVQALTADQVRQLARESTVLVDGVNPGSGVIVSRAGHTYTVLTTKHVVATEDEYTIVTFDGASYPIDYRQVSKLPGADLALISFVSDRSYRVATLANYQYDARFRNVFVSGRLKDRQTGLQYHRFAAGLLTSEDFAIPLIQGLDREGYSLFYSNITGVGMSGGPILDTDGRVIGIHGRSDGEEVPNLQGEVSRVSWGFSSGIPIATFLQRLIYVGNSLALNVQNTSPANVTIQQVNSIRPYLNPSLLPTTADAADWTNRGNQLYRLGRLQDALNALSQAVRLNPNFYLAWYERGNVLFAMKRPYEALASYDRVIQLKPNFYSVWRDRGVLLATLNQSRLALGSFDRATEIKPDDYVLWYMRGNLLNRDLHDYQRAIVSYDCALQIKPDFADALIGRGKALYELGRYDEALNDLDQAIQMNPKIFAAWVLKGRTLKTLQRYPEATFAFRQALRLQPDNTEAQQVLSSLDNR